MTKTAKQILTSLDKGEYLGLGGVDTALKELEAIHQQEITKARIDEWRKHIEFESGENGRLATLKKQLEAEL